MMIGPLVSPECVAELRSITAHMRAAADNYAQVETTETAKALARLCSLFLVWHERAERLEREREQA
jgi:hypothetical protein